MSSNNFLHFPTEFENQNVFWQNHAQEVIKNYTGNNFSFLDGCLPNIAVNLPTSQIIYILSKRFGEEKVRECLNIDTNYPSPIAENTDNQWIKKVAMVGINVRTIGTFWNVVKYALSLPNAQSAIHLLPIWECGVVSSLYGLASWYINPEFFDRELAALYPKLNTVEMQLKVVTNLLHLMGKTVGLDVVPHTDRYSEIALANPEYFEWLQRRDFEIVDHSDQLIEKVKNRIVEFVTACGSASGDYFPRNTNDFFDNEKNNEEVRLRILFGKKEDINSRNFRRNILINFLFEKGYEPVPATMAPPYRGLIVDPSDEAKTVDSEGRVWRDYIIEKPQKMSRVFGPLARYKLYKSINHNKNWELNFNEPIPEVYEYVAQKYEDICQKYNFDFMRGDMSHVQMNPQVSDNQIDIYYDLLKYVKLHVQKSKPYFGYFAESFLVEDDLMAYGNEATHLERSNTDTTLGNLQSYSLTDPQFYHQFEYYYKLAQNYTFVPNFTAFTSDKDDPRFDSFYLSGNSIRHFISIFFKYFPSYTSLGFELRDIHNKPAPNEYYTKLYVFHLDVGPKATHGPYQWGTNGPLFAEIQQINSVSDQIFNRNDSPNFELLSNIKEFHSTKILAWTLIFTNKKFVFIAVFNTKSADIQIDMMEYGKSTLILKLNAEQIDKNSLKMHPFSCVILEIN